MTLDENVYKTLPHSILHNSSPSLMEMASPTPMGLLDLVTSMYPPPPPPLNLDNE
jgi:hypothetical protein